MQHIVFHLSFVSPVVLFASIIVVAVGVKGDPMNLTVAGWGILLMLFALLTFPRAGHPVLSALERGKAKPETGAPALSETSDPSVTASAVQHDASTEILRRLVETNVGAGAFEPTPLPHHAGWSRLDPVVGPVDSPSSWIGGLPEMPQDIDWPETDGKAAMFLAQIAMADLPETIWGGLAPNSGWLLFFLAPDDWGGVRVIHVEQRGAPRAYPNGASVENYLSLDVRSAMEALGRPATSFRPQKFAFAVSPTDTDPPHVFQRLEERDEAWRAFRAMDITDPDLAPFATGPKPTRLSIEMLALDAFLNDPDTLAPGIREKFESIWKFHASVEAATMGGPVGDEFYYDAPQEPVALLRLQTSTLLGWGFGDVSSLGVFISPKHLKARRWDKAWFSIAN